MLPYSAEWDKKHHFPKDVLRELAAMGFSTIYVKQESGKVLENDDKVVLGQIV